MQEITENNKLQITSGTIARTIILILALINQVLALAGKDKIPVVENDIYQICSLAVTIVTSVWNWWKNNSFTQHAIAADEYKKQLKARKDV